MGESRGCPGGEIGTRRCGAGGGFIPGVLPTKAAWLNEKGDCDLMGGKSSPVKEAVLMSLMACIVSREFES